MDPKRLLELSGGDSADVFERELLASLRPPAAARDAVWQRLATPGVLVIGASAAGVAAAAKASASTGAAASVSTTMFTTAKLGLLLAVVAPVAAGALYAARSSAPAPQASSPAVVTIAPPRSPEPRLEPSVAEQPAEVAQIEKPSAERASERAQPEASAISEENRLLREARAASRAGDPAGALATLKVLDRRFPGGALVQERELLRVQALRAQGSHAEAEQRARRFLRLYPTSPYASHMKASLETKSP
jgi:hypothetical protein